MNPRAFGAFKKIRPSLVKRVWAAFGFAIEGQASRLWLAAFAAILGSGFELLRPWPIQWVVDRVLGGASLGAKSALTFLPDADPRTITLSACGAVVVIGFAVGQTALWSVVLAAEVGRKVTSRIRRKVFEHLHRLPFAFHQKQRTGDLLVRITGDVSTVRDLLFASWMALLGPGVVCSGTLVLMFWIDARLALVALAPLPLILLNVRVSARRMQKLAREQRDKEGSSAAHAAESLRHVRVVKAYGAEETTARTFVRDARSGDRAGVRAARLAASVARTSQVLTGIGLAAVIFFGASRVRGGALTVGQLITVISYGRSLYKPLRKVSSEGTKLGKAAACAERLLEILAIAPEPSSGGRAPGTLGFDIRFENVGYTYAGAGRGVQDLSFAVPNGALAVVSGANGSGKSTTLNLLLRLFEPDQGCVAVDGVSIVEYDLHAYRAQIAYVPQEIHLFAGTLRDNVLYGRPDADDDDVRRALDEARIGELAERGPEGLDLAIGEGASTLSGGEARRLMLARAAVRRAGLLILDEPLAGLDPDARREVAAALRAIAKGRTTIVIHHGDLQEIGPDLEIELEAGRVAAVRSRDKVGGAGR